MKKLIFAVSVLVLFVGCRKDAIVVPQDHLYYDVENIGIIIRNDVHFYANLHKEGEQITDSPNSIKTDLKMSHDYQKFAYKNEEGIVVIVDRSGTVMETLADYTNVKSFDWSLNNETLWLLNNNDIVFYGPELDLPEFSFPNIFNGTSPTVEIELLSISSLGDIAYVAAFSWYPNQNGPFMEDMAYENCFIRQTNNSTNELLYTTEGHDNQPYSNLRYSPNGQELAVTYKSNKLRLFKGLNEGFENEYQMGKSASNIMIINALNYLIYMHPIMDGAKDSRIHIKDLSDGKVEYYKDIFSYNREIFFDLK